MNENVKSKLKALVIFSIILLVCVGLWCLTGKIINKGYSSKEIVLEEKDKFTEGIQEVSTDENTQVSTKSLSLVSDVTEENVDLSKINSVLEILTPEYLDSKEGLFISNTDYMKELNSKGLALESMITVTSGMTNIMDIAGDSYIFQNSVKVETVLYDRYVVYSYIGENNILIVCDYGDVNIEYVEQQIIIGGVSTCLVIFDNCYKEKIGEYTVYYTKG